MSGDFSSVKTGLAIVFLGLFFSIGLGISFGVNEDAFKDFVAEGIAAHPDVHDQKSQDKIWRYAQRTHFHGGGIAAFCLSLIILTVFSEMKTGMKKICSILIGIGSFYPLAWLSMFLLAPALGREVAHEHLATKLLTFIGVGGLLLGSCILLANLYLGFCKPKGSADA